jgi:hypothetical protein
MKRLEDEFNLPSMDDNPEDEDLGKPKNLVEYNEALEMVDKIDNALREVHGMEEHDGEMDDIAKKAIEAFEQLMSLGHNMQDIAAGSAFNNASHMLDIALKAKESKVNRKLKQVDMMIKKANLDARERKAAGADDAEEVQGTTLDRNELMKMLRDNNKSD